MPRFHVHVDVIVRRGDTMLVMRRAVGVMTGAWYFPGGGLEEGETPEEGARRETREETGLELGQLRLFRVWTYRQDEETPAAGITFLADAPEDAEPQINEEHAAFRWMAPSEYRRRYFNDDAMAAVREHPIARTLVEAVRDLVDAYIAEVEASAGRD